MDAARSWGRAATTASVHRFGRRSLIDSSGEADVSLTSYGLRIAKVHLAIESIGRGSVRPRSLLLTLDDEAIVRSPPAPLRRLRERGLEIRHVPDLGPHKKYWPYASSTERFDRPLVTADDDVFYPRGWLEQLVAVHRRHPDDVIAHRAHHLRLDGDAVGSYPTWTPVTSTASSFRHVPTGVGGILHPPAQLQALRDAGTAFTACCPRTDDLWLHVVALRSGRRVRQVAASSTLPPWIPGLGHESLMAENVDGGGNDRAIAATYRPDDVAVLAGEEADRCSCLSEG